MHVSLFTIIPQFPWFFLPSSFERSISQFGEPDMGRPKSMLYTDVSSFTYSVEVVPDLYKNVYPRLEEPPPSLANAPFSLNSTPLLSTALIKVPYSFRNTPTSISTTLVNLVYEISSPNSCMHKPLPVHMRNVVDSLYDLEVLADARRGAPENQLGLPPHITTLQTVMMNLPAFL